tara:strand:+ start:1877 stop:2098 length:222 start_codon:yes stop_codon:yes gene_type:complete
MAFKMKYQGGGDSPWNKNWWGNFKKIMSGSNPYGRGDARGKSGKLNSDQLAKLRKGTRKRNESFGDFKKRMGV